VPGCCDRPRKGLAEMVREATSTATVLTQAILYQPP
jgi:hypothetical protein